MATGTATLAFSTGLEYTTVDVTGQSGLTADSFIEPFFQAGDTTATNNGDDHALAQSLIQVVGQFLTASSFRIHALCSDGGRASGDFKVRWATV
jgi:hypothetical protein